MLTPQERPVEHDSVISVIRGNCFSISERVSGSGRKQLYGLHLTPQAYHPSFAADVLESDTARVRLIRRPQGHVQAGGDTARRDEMRYAG